MKPFETLDGLVMPLDRANVDTDAIIPKQFLKSIKRTGYGQNLFDAWRYLDHGEPEQDNSLRPINTNFVLHQPRYTGVEVLLARRNFGCGSSREHAAWALLDFGIRCVIAPTFADIFYNNCCKNGLLPVSLSEKIVDQIFSEVSETIGYRLLIELDNQRVTTPGGEQFQFEIDPFRKYCLLNGLDQIGLTMQHSDSIKTFEKRQLATSPWLYPSKSS